MPKTIQIRDLDDEVYLSIKRHAAEEGYSVPEYLRRLVTNAAARPTLGQWLERTRRRNSGVSRDAILSSLDQMRGPWPDDRR